MRSILIEIGFWFGMIVVFLLLFTFVDSLIGVIYLILVVAQIIAVVTYWLNLALDHRATLGTLADTVINVSWAGIAGVFLSIYVRRLIGLPALLDVVGPEIKSLSELPILPFVLVFSVVTSLYHTISRYQSSILDYDKRTEAYARVLAGTSFLFGLLIAVHRLIQAASDLVVPPLNTLPPFRVFMFWMISLWGLSTGLVNLWLASRISKGKTTNGLEKYAVSALYIFLLLGILYLKNTYPDYHAEGSYQLTVKTLRITCVTLGTISLSMFLNNKSQRRQVTGVVASLLVVLLAVTVLVQFEYSWGLFKPILGMFQSPAGFLQMVVFSSLTPVAMLLVYDRVLKSREQKLIVAKGDVTMVDKMEIKTGDITSIGGQIFLGKFNDVIANLNSSGENELADALTALKEAVMLSKHLSDEKKQEQVEIIAQIGEEAAKPKPNKTLIKMLGDGLMSALKAIPDIAKAAAALAPLLAKFIS